MKCKHRYNWRLIAAMLSAGSSRKIIAEASKIPERTLNFRIKKAKDVGLLKFGYPSIELDESKLILM